MLKRLVCIEGSAKLVQKWACVPSTPFSTEAAVAIVAASRGNTEAPPGTSSVSTTDLSTIVSGENIRLDSLAEPLTLSDPPPLFIPVDVGKERVEDAPSKVFASGLDYNELSKYTKIKKSRYFGKSPEGASLGVRKDLVCASDSTEHFGMMIRPQSLQLIRQMETFATEKHPATGEFQISSRGFFLDGERGCGKSYILQHLIWWAKENGWLVLNCPDPQKFLKKVTDINRSAAGIYVQTELAKEFLDHFHKAQGSKLRHVPVNQEIYGNCCLDGNDIKYTKRVFEPLIRETVTGRLQAAAHKKQGMKASAAETLEKLNGDNEEALRLMKYQLRLKFQLSEKIKVGTLKSALPCPSTLEDIALYGIEHEAFANVCVYEIVKQLKTQTKFPVLVAVDNWNQMFKVSKFLSMRYDLTKYGGYIPGFHLALPRLLSRWDGEQLKRGIKVASTSWVGDTRRQFNAQHLGVHRSEIVTVNEFSAREFDNYVDYGTQMGTYVQIPTHKLPYFYSLSGGVGECSRKTLATFH